MMRTLLKFLLAAAVLALSAWAWQGGMQPTDVPTTKAQR